VGVLQVGSGLDLGEEPFGSDHGGQLRPKYLECDLALVLEILGEVHSGHATRAELTLEAVAVGEGRLEAVDLLGSVGHRAIPQGFSFIMRARRGRDQKSDTSDLCPQDPSCHVTRTGFPAGDSGCGTNLVTQRSRGKHAE
jgi:hypothetical protein